MAIAGLPTAKVTFSVIDESGSPGKVQLHVVNTALVADVITASDALLTPLAAIMGCTITGYTITYARKETAPAAATDGARVENKGLFVFSLANGLTSRLEVPGILEATLLPTGSIDVENAEVADFLAAIIDSPAIWRGVDGSDIVGLLSAYQRFKSSSKAQLPSDRSKFTG